MSVTKEKRGREYSEKGEMRKIEIDRDQVKVDEGGKGQGDVNGREE